MFITILLFKNISYINIKKTTNFKNKKKINRVEERVRNVDVIAYGWDEFACLFKSIFQKNKFKKKI